MATLAMSDPGEGLQPLQLTTITVAVPGSPLSGPMLSSMVGGNVAVTPLAVPVSTADVGGGGGGAAAVKWKYDQKTEKVGNTLVSTRPRD